MSASSFTPRETVGELDRYIIGQRNAKRAVAIALRNRWRRQQVPEDMRDEIAPKNIIMIGPTGVGKTEIARRLAKLARAPFVKVEASKFTEVGYVGRDVESMIRDLVEVAMKLVRDEELEGVKPRARENAEDRLARVLWHRANPDASPKPAAQPANIGPFTFQATPPAPKVEPPAEDIAELRRQIRKGEHDEERVELDVTESSNPFMTVFGSSGMEEMNLKDLFSQLPGAQGKTKRRKLLLSEAMEVVEAQEAEKLLDNDRVQREALRRTQEGGIVFLDEIDKIGGRENAQGADVSREGVQRDLLPVVEGSTVSTKYGPVKTDHILFIAAGAFHVSKVSDLIPELQGRFPIRVELESLASEDFARILTEPKNALVRQYEALMATEGVTLRFEDDAIGAIAKYAADANEKNENIGARRLHTILEALLDEISFSAPERPNGDYVIDAEHVRKTLDPILGDEKLRDYIL